MDQMAGAKMVGADQEPDAADPNESGEGEGRHPADIPKNDPMPNIPTILLGKITEAFVVTLSNRIHPGSVNNEMLARAAKIGAALNSSKPGQAPPEAEQPAPQGAPQGPMPPQQAPPQGM